MFGQYRWYNNPITAICDSSLVDNSDVHAESGTYLTSVDRKLALVIETEGIPCQILHYMPCKATGKYNALDFVLFTQVSVQLTLGFVLLTQDRVQLTLGFVLLTHGFVILTLTRILFTMGFVQYNETTNNYSLNYGESLYFLTLKLLIL